MIIGIVTAFHEATVRLELQTADGLGREIEVVLDTGFTGSLTLPPDLIADLALVYHSRGRAMIADGSEIHFNVHAATILWDRAPKTILVETADTDPLIGMQLLYGYNINIDAVDGGTVKIDRL